MACFERQNADIPGNTDNDGASPYVHAFDAGKSFSGNPIPAYVELNPIYGSVASQEWRWQFALLWSNALPLTSYTLYTRQTQDEPMGGQGIAGVVQPDAPVTYLPLPNYSCSFGIGRSGGFIRMRYDMDTGGSQEPTRLTHMTLTSESLNAKGA